MKPRFHAHRDPGTHGGSDVLKPQSQYARTPCNRGFTPNETPGAAAVDAQQPGHSDERRSGRGDAARIWAEGRGCGGTAPMGPLSFKAGHDRGGAALV
jgi:hypothetical protein